MKLKISPGLWFNTEAEEAVRHYTDVFKDSKIINTSYFTEAAQQHGHRAGTVMTVEFELNGQSFTALNGGPHFKFNEAVSLQIDCATQEEVDYYWDRLGEGGPVEAQQCGWVKDKFGLSWQVVPSILPKLMLNSDRVKVDRMTAAMLQMKKLDIEALQKAFEG